MGGTIYNVVRTFVTMNGEVQKYHGKLCLVPMHLFLECFEAVFIYQTMPMDGLYQDLIGQASL